MQQQTHTVVVRLIDGGTTFYPALEVSAPSLKVLRGESVVWTGLSEAEIRFNKGDGSPFDEEVIVVSQQSHPQSIRPDAIRKVYRYTVSWNDGTKIVRLDPSVEVGMPPPK